MPDQTEFRRKLIKPLLVFIALEILMTATFVKIITLRATHDHPNWATYAPLWFTFANFALLFGWVAYLKIRRHKYLRQQ
jgi:hypothetical protein